MKTAPRRIRKNFAARKRGVRAGTKGAQPCPRRGAGSIFNDLQNRLPTSPGNSRQVPAKFCFLIFDRKGTRAQTGGGAGGPGWRQAAEPVTHLARTGLAFAICQARPGD